MQSRNESTTSPRRRVLVGCGKIKADEPQPALELYTSGYAETKRAYAREFGADNKIISAKHHVVDADEVIEPYEQTIANMTHDEKIEWASTTREQLTALDWSDIEIADVLVAGEYLEYLKRVSAFAALPVAVSFTLTGFDGNGDQMGWLTDAVEGKVQPSVPETRQEGLDQF